MDSGKHALVRDIREAFGNDDLPECFRVFKFHLTNLPNSIKKSEAENSLSTIKSSYSRTMKAYNNGAGTLTFDEYNRKMQQLSPGILALAEELSVLISKYESVPKTRSLVPPKGYEGLPTGTLFEICTSSNPDFVVHNFDKFLDFWEANARVYTNETFDYNPATGEEIVVEKEEKSCWATGIQIVDKNENVEAEVILHEERKLLGVKIRGDKDSVEGMKNRIQNWWKQQRN
jgi:hypothetical protein